MPFCSCGKDDVAIQPPLHAARGKGKGLVHSPKPEPTANRGLANTHFRIGLALAEEGKLKEAVACFEDAVSHDPHHVEAHYMLATMFQEMCMLDQALTSFQRTIRLQPTHYAAWYNLGYLYQDLGGEKDYKEKAIRCFRKAVELEPSDVDGYINLGLSLKSAGRVSEAVSVYQKALEVDPNSVCAYFNLGNTYSDMRNLDKAILSFKRGLEVDPEHRDTLFNLGIAFQDRSCLQAETRDCDIRDAVRCYDRVGTTEAAAASQQLRLLIQAESTERRLVMTGARATSAAAMAQAGQSLRKESSGLVLLSAAGRSSGGDCSGVGAVAGTGTGTGTGAAGVGLVPGQAQVPTQPQPLQHSGIKSSFSSASRQPLGTISLNNNPKNNLNNSNITTADMSPQTRQSAFTQKLLSAEGDGGVSRGALGMRGL